MSEAKDIVSAVLQTLTSVGAGSSQGISYLSVPIKSGRREFDQLQRLACTREDLRTRWSDDWRRFVIEPNLGDAAQHSETARNSFKDSVVLDPSRLSIPALTTFDYQTLWKAVIDRHARRVIASPEWAYSQGSRAEIAYAVWAGKPVVDVFGRTLLTSDLRRADERATEALKASGWNPSLINEMLTPITLNEVGDDRNHGPSRTAVDLAFEWLQQERKIQRRLYASVDDERTRLGFTIDSDQSWWSRLHKYWDQAEISGVETEKGRELIAKFVAVAVGMLEGIVRIFGELPEPAVPSTEDPSRLRPMAISQPLDVGTQMTEAEANVIGASVFAWLSRERLQYVKPGTDPRLDERHLAEGLGRGSYWYRQLFHLYWSRGASLGPEKLAGRQQFAKFVSTSMSLLETALRVHGSLPSLRTEERRP